MIFKKDNFTIVAETFSNSRNWGHTVSLYEGQIKLSTAKIIYINRTWESWRYKSTILKCIMEYIQLIEAHNTMIYRQQHPEIKRLTASRRAEIQKADKKYYDLYRYYLNVYKGVY